MSNPPTSPHTTNDREPVSASQYASSSTSEPASFETTPSERLRDERASEDPLSDGCKKRVDLATARTEGRCVVSNVRKQYAVEYTHALKRTSSEGLLTKLEYAFGMLRGSLNVDTRLNIFPLSLGLRSLYDKGWLLLVPEKEMIERYKAGERPNFKYNREQPALYKYTLAVPQSLDDYTITRHVFPLPEPEPGSAQRPPKYETFVYPFHSFPVLEMHVHPAFMICHIGQTLHKNGALTAEYAAANPELTDTLALILEVYKGWVEAQPTTEFLEDVVPQDGETDRERRYRERLGLYPKPR